MVRRAVESWIKRRMMLVVAGAAVVLLLCVSAIAYAATYTYCNGCTINAGSIRMSNATRYAYLSYVHRLSGPSSGVYIGTWAMHPDSTIWCANGGYVTEVTCGPGWHEVHGFAENRGAGNYGFNAHLSY